MLFDYVTNLIWSPQDQLKISDFFLSLFWGMVLTIDYEGKRCQILN